MNKKFSTLMAAFLAVGATFTVEAGVVKVAAPVAGKSYWVGSEATFPATGSQELRFMTVNNDLPWVSTLQADNYAQATKWTFETATGGKISTNGKYLAAETTNGNVSFGEIGGAKVFTISGSEIQCATNLELTLNDGTAGKQLTTVADGGADNIYLYAETYDQGNADGVLTAAEAATGTHVFIKIGDKYLSAASMTTTELVDPSTLTTYEAISKASWAVVAGGKFTSAYYSTSNYLLAAATGALTIGGDDATGVLKYDLGEYAALKGATLTNSTGNYYNSSTKAFEVYDANNAPNYKETVLLAAPKEIVTAANITANLTSGVGSLVDGKNFESGKYYVLSGETAYIIVDDAAAGAGTATTAGVQITASNASADAAAIEAQGEKALWKVVESMNGEGASAAYTYSFQNKATGNYLTVEGKTAFYSTTTPGYTRGFKLLTNGVSNYVKIAGSHIVETTGQSSASTFGLYQAFNTAYTNTELNAQENGQFHISVKTAGKKEVTKGFEWGAKALTALGTIGSSKFQIRVGEVAEDGSYNVLALKKDDANTWGENTDLNGKGSDARGYKLVEVSKSDIDADAKDIYYDYFTVKYPAANAKASNKDLIIEVYQNASAATAFGRLFVASVGNENYLTTSKTINTVSTSKNEAWPLVQFGSSDLVDLTKFLQRNKFYTVAKLDKDVIDKVLGTNSSYQAAFLDKGTVQMDQPEGQWAATISDAGALVLKNRESLAAYTSLPYLYKTDKEDVYKLGATEYQIKVVEKHAATDGYEAWTNEQLRDEQYTLGFYSNVLGAAAYMSENHDNISKHLIGLEKDIKNATAWDVKAFNAKRTATAQTDSVYVVSNLYFWNKDKKGGAGWDFDADTLKTVSYKFINASNGEPVKFSNEEKAYVCDKDKDVDNAPRFAIKKMADGKYNLVTVESIWTAELADRYYSLSGNKLYGGFSVAQGNVNATGMYNKSENDLAVIEKTAAPEYVKRNMGDTIRIFREGADASILFEKGEFLGLENIHEYTKMAPAMYVDTAYYNRGTNNRWQYLLGVNIDRKVVNDDCGVPSHAKFHADTTYGRFLVNLVDSAELYKKTHLHDNKYVNTEGFAKLGFVKGFHTNDTLVIQREGVLVPAKADSIYMGSKDFNVAKFAFRIVDHETNAFKIETLYKKFSDGPAANADKLGYLKWMNGFVVVVNAIENGDTFNLEADHSAPTANEGINAVSVSVIAGNGSVTINGAAGKKVVISNVLGQTIANTVLSSDNATLSAPAGIVVVAVEGEAAVKAIVK